MTPVAISVVVPVFNRVGLVAKAVGSVVPQLLPGDELIVVDDGSTDGSGEVVERAFGLAAGGGGGGVRVVRQANAGAGAARNLGLAHAKNAYVAFLDSDDLWFPWTMATLRGVIETEAAAGRRVSLLSACPLGFEEEGELAGAVRGGAAEVERYADYLASDPLRVFPGAGSMVVSAEALRRVGGFPTSRLPAEDADLFLRLGVEPGFVVLREPATVAYRLHGGSASADVGAGVAGRAALLEQEGRGAYPGGAARRRERLNIVTSHVRSATVVALRAGMWGAAWGLYGQGLAAHLRLGRWKYVVGWPVVALLAMVGVGPGARRVGRGGRGFLPGVGGVVGGGGG